MNKELLAPPKLLHKLLMRAPFDGVLCWRVRPLVMFKDARGMDSWNSRYAGKQAFYTVKPSGYVVGGLLGKVYLAHRVIWAMHYGEWPTHEIDHINHDRSDNRIENLRDVTCRENMKNKRMRRDNTSGVCGVSWGVERNKWQVTVSSDDGMLHLGHFESKKDAIAKREDAEKMYGYHENHGRA